MVYVMMVCVGLLLAILPFGVFMGLGQALQIVSSDSRLLVTYLLIALILSYVLSFCAFMLIQQENCKKINYKQAASNAGISLGFQSITLFLLWLIPGIRQIVTNLLPIETDIAVKESIGYSYFSAWAGIFGIAIGGTLSGVCS